jgi:hypothetical protein
LWKDLREDGEAVSQKRVAGLSRFPTSERANPFMVFIVCLRDPTHSHRDRSRF